MNYSVKIKASASKAIGRIPEPDQGRIVEAIDRLAENPTAGKALAGQFRGMRRMRIGAWRVIYEVDDKAAVVRVVRAGTRSRVYSRKVR